MADPDLSLLGRRLETLQADVREIKFAADVDRQDQRAQRDVLVRQLGTSLGLFQGAVEARLDDIEQALNIFQVAAKTRLDDMQQQLARIEAMLQRLLRPIDSGN